MTCHRNPPLNDNTGEDIDLQNQPQQNSAE